MVADSPRPPLEFRAQAFAEMLAHAYAGYPLEACGLLVGRGARVIETALPSGVQAIQRTPAGWHGGADPRREGAVRGD